MLPFLTKEIIFMHDMKIYSISDKYISYLREKNPNVYSNKIESRTHTRKYIGVVISIGEFKYYIPMSSPKETDYQISGDTKVIKKSIDIVWIIEFE